MGELDLEALTLHFYSVSNTAISMTRSICRMQQLSVFDLVGGTANEIIADRLSVKGAMRLHALGANAPPRVCKLRLCGAEIRSNLDMRGCNMADTKQSLPLFADGLTVRGHVLLSDGFKAVGEIPPQRQQHLSKS